MDGIWRSFQKWAVHRPVRPEAFGGRVFNVLSGAAKYPVYEDLLNSKALHEAMPATPLHPSYPRDTL